MRKQQTTEIKAGGSAGPVAADSLEERRRTEALAYQLWLQRGCPFGSDQEDWHEAERQLQHLRSAMVRQAAEGLSSAPVSSSNS